MEGLKAAQETTKQVITLSTGVVALTITFLEKIVQPNGTAPRSFPWTLKAGWIFYFFAIVFAMWTLMAITGTLNALDRREAELPLNEDQARAANELTEGWNIRVPSLLMFACFLVAMLLTIGTGFFL